MYRIGEKPEVGSIAPDFKLKCSDGDDVRLSSYIGRVNILLAFYRGAADPYSMRWLSKLSDDYLYFRSLDTDVLGISPDSVDKARNTSTRHKIPFKLLSDPYFKAIKDYGVFDDLEDGDYAAVFLVDKTGKVRYKHVGIAPSEMPSNDELMETSRMIA